MTDMHEEVIKTAKSNVVSATEKAQGCIRRVASQAAAKVGDLLLPLKGEESFDLIYESVEQNTLVFCAYWSLPAAGTCQISRFLVICTTFATVKPRQHMWVTVLWTKSHALSPQPCLNSTISALSKQDLSACSIPTVPSSQV
jgi:hypothetical protein